MPTMHDYTYMYMYSTNQRKGKCILREARILHACRLPSARMCEQTLPRATRNGTCVQRRRSHVLYPPHRPLVKHNLRQGLSAIHMDWCIRNAHNQWCYGTPWLQIQYMYMYMYLSHYRPPLLPLTHSLTHPLSLSLPPSFLLVRTHVHVSSADTPSWIDIVFTVSHQEVSKLGNTCCLQGDRQTHPLPSMDTKANSDHPLPLQQLLLQTRFSDVYSSSKLIKYQISEEQRI